jgi:hypothetical protein
VQRIAAAQAEVVTVGKMGGRFEIGGCDRHEGKGFAPEPVLRRHRFVALVEFQRAGAHLD